MDPQNALVHFTFRGKPSPPKRRRDRSVLSTRETEVAFLVAGGNTNKEIAAELGCTPSTVAAHVSSIFRKLAFRRRSQIASLVGLAYAQEKHRRQA